MAVDILPGDCDAKVPCLRADAGRCLGWRSATRSSRRPQPGRRACAQARAECRSWHLLALSAASPLLLPLTYTLHYPTLAVTVLPRRPGAEPDGCRAAARWTCRRTPTCPARASRPPSRCLRQPRPRPSRPSAPAATTPRRARAGCPTASAAGPAPAARQAGRPATMAARAVRTLTPQEVLGSQDAAQCDNGRHAHRAAADGVRASSARGAGAARGRSRGAQAGAVPLRTRAHICTGSQRQRTHRLPPLTPLPAGMPETLHGALQIVLEGVHGFITHACLPALHWCSARLRWCRALKLSEPRRPWPGVQGARRAALRRCLGLRCASRQLARLRARLPRLSRLRAGPTAPAATAGAAAARGHRPCTLPPRPPRPARCTGAPGAATPAAAAATVGTSLPSTTPLFNFLFSWALSSHAFAFSDTLVVCKLYLVILALYDRLQPRALSVFCSGLRVSLSCLTACLQRACAATWTGGCRRCAADALGALRRAAGSEAGESERAMASHESGYPMFKHAHVEEPNMWKARALAAR